MTPETAKRFLDLLEVWIEGKSLLGDMRSMKHPGTDEMLCKLADVRGALTAILVDKP